MRNKPTGRKTHIATVHLTGVCHVESNIICGSVKPEDEELLVKAYWNYRKDNYHNAVLLPSAI